MSIEVNANNPLGLTTAGPGYGNPYAILYPGQTGNTTSGAGYTFATFGSQESGIAAGINYIQQKIAAGFTSASSLVNLFSPNDQAAFDQVTGLSPDSQLTMSNAGLYAAGIAAGEGTLSAFGGEQAFTGGQTQSAATPSSVQSTISQWLNFLAGNAPAGQNSNLAGDTANAVSGSNPSQSSTPSLVSQVESWLGGLALPAVWVVIGFVLVIGAVLIFAMNSNTVKEAARAAATAIE